MKLLSIVGARPQFIKVAPFAREIADHNKKGGAPLEHLIIHTGQHYDAGMSDIFFEELEIPRADFNLGVGSGRHGSQTGQMLEKIEQVLLDTRPDMVVIYGDTNSTVAGALAAVKLHIPVAHVEAGLRSFNRRMPEEINRIVADHTSDILLAPTPTAMANLAREGLSQKAHWTGDIMYDAVLFNRKLASHKSEIFPRLSISPDGYGLVTVHRADNTDNEQRLGSLLTVFNEIAERRMPLVFPIHPRTAKLIGERFPTWTAHPRLRLIEPLGYLDMLCLLDHARLVLTDSGGLQKEAFLLGRPCVTLREETEWVETVEAGGNVLAGVDSARIWQAVMEWEERSQKGTNEFSDRLIASFGDGRAA
ncbi:MAG: UDP-N-acetylglucosamine 2-epimerase (non-hydrolyzing), partial [Deltaproteobacteria bacterium]|nr:UDP-N-acetylglucosamine 2-epimerase (non-hydrolyzing) [Deltaproteobacteria bacterium]